ncbi:DNA glycosylase superfamily protein [Prunus dulcis]|uniref:DNA glycosylase superfamily protein n=2 Tax=Prunus dulcis TaxID=3755 RepID=A0A4Y1QQ09_PRUDU|nr:DNA glycosylase superfamily protein [Prunus dulcis]
MVIEWSGRVLGVLKLGFEPLNEEGNMVGEMKLMIAEEQKFQGKALSLSHTKTAITTIKEKFTEQQLQMFEQSCFGHLLGIEDLKWTSPIVHGLLLRKADPKTVSQLNGIKFIVGKKVIQFTAQQFCIVTGLRFGNLPFIPIPTNENCSLKRKYFANDKAVNLLELEKAFLECDDVDDVFKLGFLYFAVFVLLGSEKHVHIDMRYLKLAEDLEEFGKYPWGAVSYAKTNASLLRALCADYQRVKVPTKTAKTKKSGKKPTTTATGRPREYHLKGFPYALQIWAYEVFPALAALHLVVHEENAHIPRLLHWRSNSSPRFYELMSQVFENREVDVQLLRPSVMDKQQPYWTWGDSADDSEELVDLLGDDAEQQTGTSASVEEKEKDIDDTANLPSSSKASITGTVASRELRTLKRDFQRTKDELAKVSLSNRALCDRVHQLEDKVRKESMKAEKEFEKNTKCVEDFRNTLASMEHYFKLEIEQLKKQNGGVNEAAEGHEDLGSPHMNEGGNNDLSPLHAYVSPPTEPAVMETQVPGDGAEPSAAMVVEEAKMAASVPHSEVHEVADPAESDELPTPEDVAGCDEICQRVMKLLEDWKITKSMPSGGLMNPPSLPTVTMAGDEEGSSSVEKKEVEGKGCRQKRPAQTLLSPFTDPLRKKRTMTVSAATATPPCFDPSKSLPIEDVKAVLQFCSAWKSDISTWTWQPFLSAKGNYLIRWFLERTGQRQIVACRAVQTDGRKRGSKKAAGSNTVDLPASKVKNLHHFVRGTWQHGYAQAWTKVRKVYFPYNLKGSHWVAIELDFVRHTATVYDSYIDYTKRSKLVTLLHPISDTLARVLFDMHFYDDSEVEEVKQKGLTMSMYTPFSVCSIADVPQQRDGSNFPTNWPHSASCGILTVKFIEHLSAGMSVDKVDPLKIKYYRLKLAIEVSEHKISRLILWTSRTSLTRPYINSHKLSYMYIKSVKLKPTDDKGRRKLCPYRGGPWPGSAGMDIQKYIKVEKVPGGQLEDSVVRKGVMINKDVIAPGKMRRKIFNQRIILLDWPLQYKKGENQTNAELLKEEDWGVLLQLEEEYIERLCVQILKFKPDVVITEKGLSDLACHYFSKAGVSGMRRLRKTHNNRIAKACGAVIVNRPDELQQSDVVNRPDDLACCLPTSQNR